MTAKFPADGISRHPHSTKGSINLSPHWFLLIILCTTVNSIHLDVPYLDISPYVDSFLGLLNPHTLLLATPRYPPYLDMV